MFTKNNAVQKRGRPRGETKQGTATKQRLYNVALEEMGRSGYEGATVRDVAQKAGVSVGLLYRYFPNKQDIVLALYEQLSLEYVRRADAMLAGRWRDRFVFALRTSLQVLEPYRATLTGLIPVLLGGTEEGLFAARTKFSRHRVQQVFIDAVTSASDSPNHRVAESLGRLLYLLHLAYIMCWLLDKTRRQRATAHLVELMDRALPVIALALRVPSTQRLIIAARRLLEEALFDDTE